MTRAPLIRRLALGRRSMAASAPRTFRALAVGATANGALAVGALALGTLALGNLMLARATIRHLNIDRLRIRLLQVNEWSVPPGGGMSFSAQVP